jgi:hypothetical protein
MKGQGGVYKRGNTFWIHYSLNGTVFCESAGTDDDQKARRFLRHRLDQLGVARQGKGVFIEPKKQKSQSTNCWVSWNAICESGENNKAPAWK